MTPTPYLKSLLASMNVQEWWIDDVGTRRCGPWKEVSEMSWPNNEKVYRVVDRESFDKVCRMLELAIEQRDEALYARYPNTEDYDGYMEHVDRDNEALEKIARGEDT